MTARNWTFTDFELLDWPTLFDTHEWITGVAFGEEVCPETARKHLQGFLHMPKPQRLSFMKKIAPKAHWERMRGSIRQNKKYCEKEGSYASFGTFGSQGKRSDIEDVIDMIVDGSSQREILLAHPVAMVKYHAGFAKAMDILKNHSMPARYTLADFPKWTPITDWTKSHVFHGPERIGKTQFALAHFKNALWVRDLDTLKFFDPAIYDGIIFDDMDFQLESRTQCLNLVENEQDAAVHLRYFNGHIPAGTKKIFTSNLHNGVIFKDHYDGAIQARLTIHSYTKRI